MEDPELKRILMKPEEFLKQMRREKNSTLIVIACSGSKRNDDECTSLSNSLSLKVQQRALAQLHPSVSDFVKDFRRCTQTHHPLAVKKESEFYPSFLRYSGYFYKSIQEANINVWQVIERENWNILILSAYYGFLLAQEMIQDYNLQISKLKQDCKTKLVVILESYLNVNPQIARVQFFTSKKYTRPFVNMLKIDAFKVSLLDKVGKEIVGPYGKDFYMLVGRLFYFLISGEAVNKIDNIEEIVLQRL